MSETECSASCPYVEVGRNAFSRYTQVHIENDPHDPRSTPVVVQSYDLTALIEELVEVRDRLVAQGEKVAWSEDADGLGNCGPI